MKIYLIECRFSPDGHLLATGGQDCLLKIWVLKSAQVYFDNFSRFTSNSQSEILKKNFQEFYQRSDSEISISSNNTRSPSDESQHLLFGKPFYELSGHQAPVLDVAWSKSLFLLSCSMDKTVRLWHLSRSECLCFFRHVDFVSTIAFHPRDDRYFLSGSLDGYLFYWQIMSKREINKSNIFCFSVMFVYGIFRINVWFIGLLYPFKHLRLFLSLKPI